MSYHVPTTTYPRLWHWIMLHLIFGWSLLLLNWSLEHLMTLCLLSVLQAYLLWEKQLVDHLWIWVLAAVIGYFQFHNLPLLIHESVALSAPGLLGPLSIPGPYFLRIIYLNIRYEALNFGLAMFLIGAIQAIAIRPKAQRPIWRWIVVQLFGGALISVTFNADGWILATTYINPHISVGGYRLLLLGFVGLGMLLYALLTYWSLRSIFRPRAR